MKGEKEKKYTGKYKLFNKEFYKWVTIFVVLKYITVIANSLKAEISWSVFKLNKPYLFYALVSYF